MIDFRYINTHLLYIMCFVVYAKYLINKDTICFYVFTGTIGIIILTLATRVLSWRLYDYEVVYSYHSIILLFSL